MFVWDGSLKLLPPTHQPIRLQQLIHAPPPPPFLLPAVPGGRGAEWRGRLHLLPRAGRLGPRGLPEEHGGGRPVHAGYVPLQGGGPAGSGRVASPCGHLPLHRCALLLLHVRGDPLHGFHQPRTLRQDRPSSHDLLLLVLQVSAGSDVVLPSPPAEHRLRPGAGAAHLGTPAARRPPQRGADQRSGPRGKRPTVHGAKDGAGRAVAPGVHPLQRVPVLGHAARPHLLLHLHRPPRLPLLPTRPLPQHRRPAQVQPQHLQPAGGVPALLRTVPRLSSALHPQPDAGVGLQLGRPLHPLPGQGGDALPLGSQRLPGPRHLLSHVSHLQRIPAPQTVGPREEEISDHGPESEQHLGDKERSQADKEKSTEGTRRRLLTACKSLSRSKTSGRDEESVTTIWNLRSM